MISILWLRITFEKSFLLIEISAPFFCNCLFIHKVWLCYMSRWTKAFFLTSIVLKTCETFWMICSPTFYHAWITYGTSSFSKCQIFLTNIEMKRTFFRQLHLMYFWSVWTLWIFTRQTVWEVSCLRSEYFLGSFWEQPAVYTN